MKKFYILLISVFVVNWASGQWVPQNSGVNYCGLSSIFYTDTNNGYMTGGYEGGGKGDTGFILKTINGGANWTSQNLTSFRLYSIHFVNMPNYDKYFQECLFVFLHLIHPKILIC